MDRFKALEEVLAKLPGKKLVARLNQDEANQLTAFIAENDELGHLEFEQKINRMHLVSPKTKNWGIVVELLCAANFRACSKAKAS